MKFDLILMDYKKSKSTSINKLLTSINVNVNVDDIELPFVIIRGIDNDEIYDIQRKLKRRTARTIITNSDVLTHRNIKISNILDS